MIYYNRFPMDWKRDTAGLSLSEQGAYSVLIDQYYASDGKLTADRDALFRIVGAVTPEERAAVERVIGIYFSNGDGKLRNKRADAEIQIYENRAKIARRNGKNGGRPKSVKHALPLRGKPVGLSEGSLGETQTITQTKATHLPSPISRDKNSDASHRVNTGWTAQAGEDWEVLGQPPYGQIGKCLSPLVEKFGWESVRPAWQRFIRESDPLYANPSGFASKFEYWRGKNVLKRGGAIDGGKPVTK